MAILIDGSREENMALRPRTRSWNWGVAQKLWLGLGLVLTVLAASGLVSYHYIQRIEGDLHRVVAVEEPLEEAVLEMEINAGETATAVLNYFRDRDSVRVMMMHDAVADFRRHAAEFERLAETDVERRLGRQAAALFTEFTELSKEIIALVDQRSAARNLFRLTTRQAHKLLDDKLRAAIDPAAREADEKLHVVAKLEHVFEEIVVAAEMYATKPDAALRQAFIHEASEFKDLVALYLETNPSAEEKYLLIQIGDRSNVLVGAVNAVMTLTDTLFSRFEKFEQDLADLDAILDDRIQPLIDAETTKAAADAKASTQAVEQFLLILGAVGLLVSSCLVWALSRGIVDPVQELLRGTEIIGEGKLDHRIDFKGKGEFGQLAAGFNRMTEKLQRALQSVEKSRAQLELRVEERTAELQQELSERKRVEAALRKSEEILSVRAEELEMAHEQLERMAYFDALTGLANRAHCQKDLVDKFTFADPDSKFAVIQIDLDNFKRVNDTLGHAAGDHLLRVLGERLSLLTRELRNFKPYRWGGDEFIALVERDDDTDLHETCQELTDLIAIPLEFQEATLRPTVSLGVARYPEDAADLEALMIFADLALYKTKELGRDGYQFFTSEMKQKVDAESRIEQELRIAIENGQLELYYQPQLDMNDETITGLEALLRWNHPRRGVIGPGEFLSVVDAVGLAPAVGREVFDGAMAAVRCWVDDGVEFGRLSVNLSPQHLKQGSMLDDFFDAMGSHGVEPRFLAVEFLESFLLDDPNADFMNILKQLRERGVHVELDDFGTGYASLSHLSTMPITGLKIDRSFVHQMNDDPKQQSIVSALISMSRLMDLRVVCEGVETWQQVSAIAQISNCSIQGYFVAKPMSFKDTTDWIRNKRYIGILNALPDIAMANG